MCGQMGWIWKKGISPGWNIPLAATLEVLMDNRGGHSWGYYADGVIRKGLGDIVDSVPARNLGGVRTFIGHTRLATTGKICEANSHPFEIGNIIGTHNGMVYNEEQLRHKYDRTFEVDSMHIFAHLNEGLPTDEINGYGSAVWLDKNNPETINFVRWNNGDLALAEAFNKNKELVGVIWASTPQALVPAMKVAGLKERLINVKEEHRLYTNGGEELHIDESEKMKFGHGTRGTGYQHVQGYGGEYVKGNWVPYVDGKLPEQKPETKRPQPNYTLDKRNEIRKQLRGKGIKVIDIGDNGLLILHPNQQREWPTTALVQSRKCASCDLANQMTARHPELGMPLCFDCTQEYDRVEGKKDVVKDAEILDAEFQQIVQDVEINSEEAFKDWLLKGKKPENGKLILPERLNADFPPKEWIGIGDEL